jgi:hypothetical protein
MLIGVSLISQKLTCVFVADIKISSSFFPESAYTYLQSAEQLNEAHKSKGNNLRAE